MYIHYNNIIAIVYLGKYVCMNVSYGINLEIYLLYRMEICMYQVGPKKCISVEM